MAVENSSEIFKILDPDGTLRYANPAFERVLGYDPESAVGMNVLHYVHPEDLPRILEQTETAMNLQGVGRNVAEYRFRHADGSWRYLESTGTYLLDDPSVRGVVVTARDITERKEMEEALRESERRYANLLADEPALVYRCVVNEPDWPMEFASDYALELTGYQPHELIVGGGVRYGDLIVEKDYKQVWSEVQEALEERRPFRLQYSIRHKDGTLCHVEEYGRAILTEDGQLEAIEGLIYDVTEREEAEEAVRRSEASLVEAQRMAHLGSFEWYVRTGEIRWSDETYRIHGLEPGRYIPTIEKLLEAVHPDDRDLFRSTVERAFRDHEPYDFVHRVIRPNGETRWVHRRAEVIRTDGGEPLSVVGTAHDVTDQKTLEERLERQAFHDSLTGLPNRPLFVDRLGHALERTERRKEQNVAVLFMDLDGFKVINDSLGHEAGDLLLVEVADRLRGCLRPEDTLARFGGDEFTVLLEDVESSNDAVLVAERVIDEFRAPFVLADRQLFVSASIGVALYTADTRSSEDLLRAADTAMYRAKEQSSGYSIFDPTMYERAVRRLDLENDLRRAIEAREFIVHYQPIVRLQGNEVWGMEALVRWEHPEHGLLPPSDFVPVIEESGLIVPMGQQMLKEACHLAKELQEDLARVPPLVMCVNLSAKQLRRPDLAKTVQGVLQETGLEARSLSLDVTETVYIKALEGNTVAVDGLKKLGVGIAIDDFGVGYSSLSYLKRLPADILKIDKSFVRGLGEDIEDTAIVHMIIELAHTLGMEVVAEGVESVEQEDLLRDMGCDFAQGFYISQPLPRGAVSSFLSQLDRSCR